MSHASRAWSPLLSSARRTVGLWAWAALVGGTAAAAPFVFHWLLEQVEFAATGQLGGLEAVASVLPPWRRVLVCTFGGALAGFLLEWGQRWATRGPMGDRHVDYIDAAREGTVVLNDRTTAARTASALVSIGTGASIGREGPTIQLAAWASAWLARWAPVEPAQRTTILACGIAAGIGSAYHAPLAGLIFVLELALGFFARGSAAALLIASATASSLIYWLVTPEPLYSMPVASLAPSSLGAAAAGGLVFGGLGWFLLHALDRTREWGHAVRTLPVRLGLGGLVVGLVSAFVPEVWGNGYTATSRILSGGEPWQWIALLFVAKGIATVASTGSGAIGGVFTPSLFLGAAAGSLTAEVTSYWLPSGWGAEPATLAVIGMASVLTAVTHSPLMSIVMVLEMTRQFQLAVPVMLACGIAYAVSTQMGSRPLFGNPIDLSR